MIGRLYDIEREARHKELTHIAALPPKIGNNAVNNSEFINNL
jgi:hypothetical protein